MKSYSLYQNCCIQFEPYVPIWKISRNQMKVYNYYAAHVSYFQHINTQNRICLTCYEILQYLKSYPYVHTSKFPLDYLKINGWCILSRRIFIGINSLIKIIWYSRIY
jgi:hypothetical protein